MHRDNTQKEPKKATDCAVLLAKTSITFDYLAGAEERFQCARVRDRNAKTYPPKLENNHLCFPICSRMFHV